MKKAPISVCMIVKNEPLLEKSILSFRDYVEELVIVDTGSTDGETIQVAKKYANVFQIFTDCNDPETGMIENFSLARQRSFDLATLPAILWLDSDDIIVGAEKLLELYETAKKLEKPGKSVGFLFPYEYSYNEAGQCTCRHFRERLFTNKDDIKWVNWVHEVLVPKSDDKIILYNREDLIYQHKRQVIYRASDPSRNLRILKKYVETHGDSDARQLYYLGLEYFNNGMLDDAIKCLTKYISVSGWPDEQVMACLKLVDIYFIKKDFNEALKWGFKSIELKHNWCEGYFAVAKMFYFMGLQGGPQEFTYWEKCVHFIKSGLSFPPSMTSLFINPLERECDIHKYYNIALNKLGNVKGALDSVNLGMLVQPNDPHFVNNKKLYEDFLARHEITVGCNVLKKNGSINEPTFQKIISLINSQEVIDKVLSASPIQDSATQEKSSIEDFSFKQIFLEEKLSKVDHPLDIIFVLGDGVETWTPETVKHSGMGGSETMAMELSKRLAAMGHKVRLYNSCGQMSGVYDGVEYLPSKMYQGATCDVLIVSRNVDFLDPKYEVEAKLKLLWVHDIFAINAKSSNLLRADRILALTEWHKNNLIDFHQVHPDKIIVTRNGIDLSRFNKNIPRNKYRAVNSSSPDRSWPILLEVWPRIKARVPKAELHLFYGFKNWRHSAQYMPGHNELIDSLERKIKELQPLDVVYHDRVSQEQLAEEFLKSGCWIYPSWFSETFCCHPETLISVPDSANRLTNVKIKDLVGKMDFPVYCYDEQSHQFTIGNCKKVWKTKTAKKMVYLTLDNHNILKLTPEHLVMNSNAEWVKAESLKIDDKVTALHLTHKDVLENHKIIKTEIVDEEIDVYDMEVDNYHNFIADGVVVHNCISAAEAQAAGLRMISSSIAALNETVGDRGVLIDGEWTSPVYQQKFIDSVVEAMNRNDGSDRVALQKYAGDNFGLNNLAKEWNTMISSLLEEIKINPISPYYPTREYRKV